MAAINVANIVKQSNCFNRILQILGQKYSSFQIEVQQIAVKYFEELNSLPEPIPFAVTNSNDMKFYNPIRLTRFLCALTQKQLIDFRRIVTVTISNGKQMAYAINSDDIHIAKHDTKFRQYLSETISHALVHHLP